MLDRLQFCYHTAPHSLSSATFLMQRLDIYYSIRRAGYRNVDIANELRVAPSVVGEVIAGTKRSRRVALKISKILDIPVSKLWPGGYPKLELEELRRHAA